MANKLSTQATGRMGELAVEMELLRRGWTPGNFNATTKNTAAWDLFAVKGSRNIKLRVKANRAGETNLIWNAKKDGSIFLDLRKDDDTDFVAIVSFDDETARGYSTYVLPTEVVESELQNSYATWLAGTKRDGGARKVTSMRQIGLDDRTDKFNRGYAVHWSNYREAWHLLEGKTEL